MPQKTHFGHFGSLGPDLARIGLKRLILATLAALVQIWPELGGPQGAHFGDFGGLGANLARIGPWGLILATSEAKASKCLNCAAGGSF